MADMSTWLMLDDVDLSIEEKYAGAAKAVAGYVNGKYANWPAIVLKYGTSGKHLLSIDVQANPNAGAQCLDIETGDATIGQAVKWVKETQAAGKALRDLRWFPKLYVQAGNMASLVATLKAGGVARDEVMIWSAHFTGKAHICSPESCGYPQADATQWTDDYEGVSLDASLCYGYFFAGPPAVVKPEPVKPVVVTPPKPVEPVKPPVVAPPVVKPPVVAPPEPVKPPVVVPPVVAPVEPVKPPVVPVDPPKPAPTVLVYVQTVLTAAEGLKIGYPDGTIVFVPHTVTETAV